MRRATWIRRAMKRVDTLPKRTTNDIVRRLLADGYPDETALALARHVTGRGQLRKVREIRRAWREYDLDSDPGTNAAALAREVEAVGAVVFPDKTSGEVEKGDDIVRARKARPKEAVAPAPALSDKPRHLSAADLVF